MPGATLGFRLLCITDRHTVSKDSLEEALKELIGSGLRAVQLREKDMPVETFRLLLGHIQKLSEGMPIRLFVNTRVDVAREFGLGLHLPDGSDVAAARKAMGPDAVVGVSVHSEDGARAAERNGASFVMFGPIFQTRSKSGSPPAGLDALSGVCKAVQIPVVAVGGITPKNAASCLESGAKAVASIGALLSAPNRREALVDFMRALGRL